MLVKNKKYVTKIEYFILYRFRSENLKEKYIHVRKIHVQNLPKVAGD
jgi:hypothetical protein